MSLCLKRTKKKKKLNPDLPYLIVFLFFFSFLKKKHLPKLYRGGLETLFQNSKSIEVTLTEPFHLQHLISILSTQVNPISSMSLFCSPGPDYDIKPGILPLVNDEDWELLEPSGMKAILKDGDQVMFISTLHGG